MSGIIFNGQEMKKGENVEDYINRVVNNVVNITIRNSEQKQLKCDVKVSDEDTSTDGDSSEEISDTDEEENEKARRIYNNPLYKRVMLGTYNISMDEHDRSIDRFNSKYGIYERGSNGSPGHYFTHG